MLYDLGGKWTAILPTYASHEIFLPGTLDTNGLGMQDTVGLETRLTRKHTYEGKVIFQKEIKRPSLTKEQRLFFEVERARVLRVYIRHLDENGYMPEGILTTDKEIEPYEEGTLSTPHIYELPDNLPERFLLRVVSDNSYPDMPHDPIVYSSAATDHTQTNWNGLLGFIRLRSEEKAFISTFNCYTMDDKIKAVVTVDSREKFSGHILLTSDAFEENHRVKVSNGINIIEDIQVKPSAKKWDEGEGNLYLVAAGGEGLTEIKKTIGIRNFGIGSDRRFSLNNRTFFLRGEAHCAAFPETGHPPMTKAAWQAVLTSLASYGVNCVRFHSHCPPEAAFFAADEMGMLIQPELSHWNPENAFEDECSYAYYKKEITQILKFYGNHPSFVMLTWGNELIANESGHKRMEELLDYAHQLDNTRLYADGSNNHYGNISIDSRNDFYTSMAYKGETYRGINQDMIGHINEAYPGTGKDYTSVVDKIHEEFDGPVFSFEVGQFQTLPDFDEIDLFQGVTLPVNLQTVRDRAEEKKVAEDWKRKVAATGELALICYREEFEAALRTTNMSGISLLSLQDFPGQGTALVGMMNTHMAPKPYDFAKPERFRDFFRQIHPMLLMEKYTYSSDEVFRGVIKIANYSKASLKSDVKWQFLEYPEVNGGFLAGDYLPGGLTDIGTIETSLNFVKKPERLNLQITVGEWISHYPLWVYPDLKMEVPGDLIVARRLDEVTLSALVGGARVLYDPICDEDHIPNAINSSFSTDFWSVGTFPSQEGGMGLLIDEQHPVFEKFPTEYHCNYQWWPMSKGRAVFLPSEVKPIVTVLDSYRFLRHMGLLFEANVGKGRIMVTTMGLHDKGEYPEVRALWNSICQYMSSEAFRPESKLEQEELVDLFLLKG